MGRDQDDVINEWCVRILGVVAAVSYLVVVVIGVLALASPWVLLVYLFWRWVAR